MGPTSDGSRRLMPEKKDRDMWWAFLEGKPEAEWTPVQKSNGKSKNQVTRGLRAWADEPPRQQEPDNPIYELSPNNDEGEVEEVLKMDPADSLPSPAGTPVLPLEYLEDVMQPSSTTPCICKPREPTTQLLKLINGVRSCLSLLQPANGRAENCPTFVNVLYSLDAALSQVYRTRQSCADGIACPMDFRTAFAC